MGRLDGLIVYYSIWEKETIELKARESLTRTRALETPRARALETPRAVQQSHHFLPE